MKAQKQFSFLTCSATSSGARTHPSHFLQDFPHLATAPLPRSQSLPHQKLLPLCWYTQSQISPTRKYFRSPLPSFLSKPLSSLKLLLLFLISLLHEIRKEMSHRGFVINTNTSISITDLWTTQCWIRIYANPYVWVQKLRTDMQDGGQIWEVTCERIAAFFLLLLKSMRLSKKLIGPKVTQLKV